MRDAPSLFDENLINYHYQWVLLKATDFISSSPRSALWVDMERWKLTVDSRIGRDEVYTYIRK